jgi:hypothetical protein
MAFSDMNDVEQELGEEKPPKRNGNGNGNRTFLIIAGVLGGIMILALLCIAGLALYRYIPAQRAAQSIKATQDAQNAADILAMSQTAAVPTATATRQPTYTPTNTSTSTSTPVIVLLPTKSPTHDIAIVTRDYLLTQTAVSSLSSQAATALPSAAAFTPTQLPSAAAFTPTQLPSATPFTPTQLPSATPFTPTQLPSATPFTPTQLPSAATFTPTKLPSATPFTPSPLPSATPFTPTPTGLPSTGIAEQLGTPGLLIAAIVLVAVVFVMRRLRTAS